MCQTVNVHAILHSETNPQNVAFLEKWPAKPGLMPETSWWQYTNKSGSLRLFKWKVSEKRLSSVYDVPMFGDNPRERNPCKPNFSVRSPKVFLLLNSPQTEMLALQGIH